MPRFDKTGPTSKGPKTGRGLGVCSDTTDENTKIKAGFPRRFGLKTNIINKPNKQG